ncbi:MAG: alkylation response protein AidB-like acyl-CoA dehydrogenase [Myxococcota bacterium]|jgi:alkylation response protein AidB-like acyl-CoA dehydrogenase
MELSLTSADETFRDEVRTFLEEALSGDFKELRGRGGPGDDDALIQERIAFERALGTAGLTCVGWPVEHGGRGATLMQQVVYHEEYARAHAPGRAGHIGEGLLGPTVIAFGTEAQKQRFLPPIAAGEEFWAQGYSEPNAGSDLANVQTRATLEDGQWSVTGQKIWTSGAHWADWCFVLCRTDTEAPKHRGISYLLVPMRQEGIEVRPIVQLTGTAEFCEVFFDDARTDEANVVGPVNSGWRVAMGTLAVERGASTLGQQHAFQGELDAIIALAKTNGAASDPAIRQRLADAIIGLRIMRLNALRVLNGLNANELSRAAMTTKLFWATWHRELGKLAMDVMGPEAEVIAGDGYDLKPLQKVFLFSRSDTIYAGTNQIQRNIIGERALGLPRKR